MHRVLVMGASGRIGAYLRQFWKGLPIDPVWQYRGTPIVGGLFWNPMTGPVPDCCSIDAVLCLSGVTSGDGLGRNTDLARAALGAARRLGVGRVLLASSSAVYGAAPGPHDESDACHPVTAYGASKLTMEQAAFAEAHGLDVTCLRIGNVAGADALLGGLRPGRVPCLDQFPDAAAPRRAYIGPQTLARVLGKLACHPMLLPPVLNVAQPGLIGMDSLLRAAAVRWTWQPAPATALPELSLGLDRLQTLCPIASAAPDTLVAEWRLTWAVNHPTGSA